MRMVLAAAVLALASGHPAAAQDDMAQREAVAAEYLALALETMDLGPVVDQSAGMLLGVIRERQPELYAEKAARLEEIVNGALARNMREAMLGLDVELARTLTLEELIATRDFYASPVGRSAMRKMPGFMAAQMPRIVESSLGASGEMLETLAAEGVELQ